ncbi:hypothetical protein SCYAM73S_01260 [Streptomyces cyaneofuscatus]
MKLRKVTAASATVLALALTATACGGDDRPTGRLLLEAAARTRSRSASSWTSRASARRPRRVTRASTWTSPPTSPRSSVTRRTRSSKRRSRRAPTARPCSQRGDVDFIAATYSITPERQEKVDFAGPYLLAHQDVLIRADDDKIKSPRGPEQREALLGHRFHLGAERQGEAGAQGAAPAVPDVLGLPARSAERCRRRAHHGRLDPRRLRRPGAVQGQVQARRLQANQREARHRRQEGQRPQGQDQQGPRGDGLRRFLGDGREGQLRPRQLPERARAEDRRHQEAEASA